MKEYIDRRNLIEEYCRDNCGNRRCRDAWDKCTFISYVLEEPTADVRENVHAKWIWKDFNYDGSYTLCCSECLETKGAREDAKFCSECGAQMDLEQV